MTDKLTLKIISTEENFQILEINISGNGNLIPKELKTVKLPDDINYTKGVVIYGKAPVWLFSMLSHDLHIAKWVATFDPRLGAVVVQSHDAVGPNIGEVLSSDRINKYISVTEPEKKKSISESILDSKIICIVGPANSGKSVFLNLLRKKLNDNLGEKFRKDYFIIRACPDGEGDWFGDINLEEGKIFRIKKEFNDEFIDGVVSSLKEIKNSKKVVFVDCGGKIDKKNQRIFNESTHGLIVSSNRDKVLKWEGALEASELKRLAVIHSKDYDVSGIIGENEFEIGKLYRGNEDVEVPEEMVKMITDPD